MPDRPQANPIEPTLRARLAAEVAAGRTVVLSHQDLAAPEVRSQLPSLLEQLAGSRPGGLNAPLTVPGYTVLGAIGQGGMSTVYLARHDALGRHVALKVAPLWLATDRRAQERMLFEARAMARVRHHNIVAIHDVVELDDAVVLAMEWVDGLTLAALLRALPRAPREDDVAVAVAALGTEPARAAAFDTNPVRWFARMLHEVARAVHCVHEAGLLHLDIKPSNVLVRRDGTPLLADFGVVREIDIAATQTRTFAGTPAYCSPEQLRRDDRQFGPATDVYGLGMTLFECIARVQPLQQLGLTRIVQIATTGRMPRLSTLVPVAPDLENIVHKAIAPEPRHRYRSAAEFADDLAAFLEHRPVKARPLTAVARLARWTRNEPWKAALAGALAVLVPLLVGLGGFLLAQLPRLEQVRRAERQVQANELKQVAFRDYFRGERHHDSAMLLRDAMALDPGATSLACLLAMALEAQHDSLPELLREHRGAIEANAGLRAFAAKVAAGRAYFTADEVEQLRQSRDATDHYVLALDRVLWADDWATEEGYAEATRHLEAAMLTAPRDPLLYGLCAWTMPRGGDHAGFADLATAMQSNWPGSFEVTAWLTTSASLHHDRQTRYLADFLDQQPTHREAWLLMTSNLTYHWRRRLERRSGPPAAELAPEVERWLARATAVGVVIPELEQLRDRVAAWAGDDEAKREFLRRRRAVDPQSKESELTWHLEPAAFDADAEALLQEPAAPYRYWLTVLRHACRDRTRMALVDRLEREVVRRFPDRKRHVQTLVGFYCNTRRMDDLRRFAPGFTPPRDWIPFMSPFLASALVSARAWEDLGTLAQRWRDLGPPETRAQASFYLGLACSRRGDPIGAARHLADALAVRAEKGVWYGNALLEDAWLRAGSGMPAELRSPAIAAARIEAWAAHPPPSQPADGLWTALVQAEVRYANGDREGALSALELGRRRREPHAPDELDRLLAEARSRYGAR